MRAGIVMAEDGEGVVFDWTGLLTPEVLAVLGVLLIVLLLITMLAGWLTVRRLRRSGAPAALRRGVDQARAHADALLAPPGARREAGELRRRLQDAHAATVHGLASARTRNVPLGEFPSLIAALSDLVDSWQRCLGALARERDESAARAGVEAARPHVQQLLTTMGAARTALLGLRDETLASEHAALDAQVRDEAEVLQTWTRTYRALGRP